MFDDAALELAEAVLHARDTQAAGWFWLRAGDIADTLPEQFYEIKHLKIVARHAEFWEGVRREERDAVVKLLKEAKAKCDTG
jgi:hypothetical protein